MFEIQFRKPSVNDAQSILALVKSNKPLDENSLYLYALLCHHFSDTCFVAEYQSKVIGFLSGFLLPKNPQTFFVWQVGVDSKYRNQGVAKNLVSCVLNQTGTRITSVEATVTASNKASLAFLKNFANDFDGEFSISPLFSKSVLGENHEPEDLVKIGPITNNVQEIEI